MFLEKHSPSCKINQKISLQMVNEKLRLVDIVIGINNFWDTENSESWKLSLKITLENFLNSCVFSVRILKTKRHDRIFSTKGFHSTW